MKKVYSITRERCGQEELVGRFLVEPTQQGVKEILNSVAGADAKNIDSIVFLNEDDILALPDREAREDLLFNISWQEFPHF